MNRGGNHRNIFLDKSDYEYFLELLRNTKEKYPYELHAYCLMTNHYHLLIETKDKEIWHIMKRIDQFYTEYFNSKYRQDGSLFRGRYRGCEVKDDSHFLQVSRYICLNPVKARMVKIVDQYKWSSFNTMIGSCSDKVTSIQKTLMYFLDESKSRQLYREFVESGYDNVENENKLRKEIGEEEEWLPW